MNLRSKLLRKREKGSVAVEMAVSLPVFLMMLAVPLFFARAFLFYSVGQKAAHDATRFLATATQAEMRTPGGGFGETNVAATARWIAQEELRELLPFVDGIPIEVQCNSGVCGGASTVPQTVHVGVQIIFHDALLGGLTSEYIGNTNMTMYGNVTMRYVGR